MGSRSGDIDAAIVLHLMAKEELGSTELNALLNKHSGLIGLSGLSNDMRKLLEAEAAGNERAKLAIDVFCYRLRKYVGAYVAALGGLDALVFTGGIGENAPAVRARSAAGARRDGDHGRRGPQRRGARRSRPRSRRRGPPAACR